MRCVCISSWCVCVRGVLGMGGRAKGDAHRWRRGCRTSSGRCSRRGRGAALAPFPRSLWAAPVSWARAMTFQGERATASAPMAGERSTHPTDKGGLGGKCRQTNTRSAWGVDSRRTFLLWTISATGVPSVMPRSVPEMISTYSKAGAAASSALPQAPARDRGVSPGPPVYAWRGRGAPRAPCRPRRAVS